LEHIDSVKGLCNITMDEMFPWQANTPPMYIYSKIRNAVDFNNQSLLSLILQGMDMYKIKISNRNYLLILKDLIINDLNLEWISMLCTYKSDLIQDTLKIACKFGKFFVVQLLKENFSKHITNWKAAQKKCHKYGHVYLERYCE